MNEINFRVRPMEKKGAWPTTYVIIIDINKSHLDTILNERLACNKSQTN